VGRPTLQGARTVRGSRSPGTASGTRSPGTRGERDHQARVGGCLFFFVTGSDRPGRHTCDQIRSSITWARRTSDQSMGRPTVASAGAPSTRASPDGARASLARPQTASPVRRDGMRSKILFFFLSCDRWLEPWQIRRSQRGGSPNRIWTNSRGTRTIRSLATNDVTIRSETFDEEQFCKIRSTTLCSNLSNLTTAHMINNQQINLAVSNPVI
jgi:hypothetical protein